MTQWERYFDNAATTPLDPRVLDEMMPFLTDGFGNSESLHAFGQRARAAVELARERVATLMDASFPEQIVFGSGATESCNWVLANFETGFIGPFEHSAVREPALARGFTVVANDGLDLALPPESGVVNSVFSQMMVNNEIGTIWDPRVNTCQGDCLHSDATQALGKIPLTTDGIGYLSSSAHKVYGPKGVGATYVGDGLRPGQLGGQQEFGFRAGTVNVPGVVGFGAACAIAEQEMADDHRRAAEMRAIVLEELRALSDWQVNGGENVVPHILSVSFWGIEGETLVVDLDARGFAISAGAACSSRSTEPSHVLVALGLHEQLRRGTIRISFGRFNTPESAQDLATNLLQSVQKLRTMS